MAAALHIPRSPEMPEGADYAVTLRQPDTVPAIAIGETVYVARTDTLADGDVGLFRVNGRTVCRQICQDCFGTVYLLALNPDCRGEDLTVPAAERDGLLCYGKVLLPQIPPLPVR